MARQNAEDEWEDISRRRAKLMLAAVSREPSPSNAGPRDLNEDRDTRPDRVRADESRPVLGALDFARDRTMPLGPPGFDPIPNVPPFPNITFNIGHRAGLNLREARQVILKLLDRPRGCSVGQLLLGPYY